MLVSAILRVATSNAGTGTVVSAGTVFGLDAVRMGKVLATKRGGGGVSCPLHAERSNYTDCVTVCMCVCRWRRSQHMRATCTCTCTSLSLPSAASIL